MAYSRIVYRVPGVEVSYTGKGQLSWQIDSTSTGSGPTKINMALGSTLYSDIIKTRLCFPNHMREVINRMYNWLKENQFPLQVSGECIAITSGGIYSITNGLVLSPVRPDFEVTDDLNANIDVYGMGLAVGADVVSQLGMDSSTIKISIDNILDYAKDNVVNAP